MKRGEKSIEEYWIFRISAFVSNIVLYSIKEPLNITQRPYRGWVVILLAKCLFTEHRKGHFYARESPYVDSARPNTPDT